mmetsp:Transcript_72271/g.227850  ORF Transcript_72271/g.227850 Transcript_72271/m.227850 type:complete len:223 (-) Transcript_72271:209-877(-)
MLHRGQELLARDLEHRALALSLSFRLHHLGHPLLHGKVVVLLGALYRLRLALPPPGDVVVEVPPVLFLTRRIAAGRLHARLLVQHLCILELFGLSKARGLHPFRLVAPAHSLDDLVDGLHHALLMVLAQCQGHLCLGPLALHPLLGGEGRLPPPVLACRLELHVRTPCDLRYLPKEAVPSHRGLDGHRVDWRDGSPARLLQTLEPFQQVDDRIAIVSEAVGE